MRIFLFFVTLVAVIGCSGLPIEVKASSFVLPTGFAKGATDDGAVEIAIPGGWRQGVDRMMESPLLGQSGGMGETSAISDPEATKALQDMSGVFAEMSNEAEREALEKLKKKGNVLNVISMSNKPIIGEARTRFYVQKTTQGANWSWDSAHQLERDQYFHKQAAKEVDLPIGKAHRMEETITKVDGGVKTTISYLIPNGKDLYCLRFVTQEDANVIKSIEKQVAQSIRIK
ncbi:MAG: hypothetical protein QE269_12965 [Fimbriimonas sp.]|nr:hypothetical protein [Fimbriimonas sp.]